MGDTRKLGLNAVSLAAETLVPEHFAEVANRRIEQVDKTLAAVNDRLLKEISFWQDRWIKLSDDLAAGKGVRLNVDNVTRTIRDLEGRLENRKRELHAMRHVVNGTPVVLGGALVIPAGLLGQKRGEEPTDPVVASFAADAAARARIVQPPGVTSSTTPRSIVSALPAMRLLVPTNPATNAVAGE